MLFIVGVILAFVFLDWPWRALVIIGLALIEGIEILLFLTTRRMKKITGAEAMVGIGGRATTDVRPEGQVWVKGQLWKARSRSGVEAGQDVRVVDIDGIVLEVEPAGEPDTYTRPRGP